MLSISFKLSKYCWYGIFSFNAVLNSSILSVKKFCSGTNNHCKALFNNSIIVLGNDFIPSHKLPNHSHRVVKKSPKFLNSCENQLPIVEPKSLKNEPIFEPNSLNHFPNLLNNSLNQSPIFENHSPSFVNKSVKKEPILDIKLLKP